MIDWAKTRDLYGYGEEILSSKRPAVICTCDKCHKPNKIKIRSKKRLTETQIDYLCPSCVKLKQSDIISTRMKSKWNDQQYKQHQLKIKASIEYKTKQSEKSIQRWQNKSYRIKIQKGINKQEYLNRSSLLYGDQFDYSNTNFESWHDRIDVKCNQCKKILNKNPQKHLDHGYCQYCGITRGQKEITEYISSLGLDVRINDRKSIPNLELDIYIPSHKLAIEYNGIYWHSYSHLESYKERHRHQHKSLLCIDRGIKLLQFYDFEWDNKKNIVKSMISNSLSTSKKLDARKLIIKLLNNKSAQDFFSNNHLFGHRPASTTLSLVDEEGIHCALSFSKVKDGYEIIRMASKTNESIRGGASRLIKHFTSQHPGKLFSFADLRYSNGNSYEKLGFTKIRITPPGYFYSKQLSDRYEILSRQQCQKNKLPKLLGASFDSSLSESQNMFNNNYRRVWTAGNILYSKD